MQMEHALNMCIFFPFTDIYIVEVLPFKSLILIRKAFFSINLLKYTWLFFQILILIICFKIMVMGTHRPKNRIKTYLVFIAVHMQAKVDILRYSSGKFETFGNLSGVKSVHVDASPPKNYNVKTRKMIT